MRPGFEQCSSFFSVQNELSNEPPPFRRPAISPSPSLPTAFPTVSSSWLAGSPASPLQSRPKYVSKGLYAVSAGTDFQLAACNTKLIFPSSRFGSVCRYRRQLHRDAHSKGEWKLHRFFCLVQLRAQYHGFLCMNIDRLECESCACSVTPLPCHRGLLTNQL